MRRFRVSRAAAALPDLTGRRFDPAKEPFCLQHAYAPIDTYPWDESGYAPEARAYVALTAEGFDVLLCAREQEICVETRQFGGPVYRDSCLEFFLQPIPGDDRYVNLEGNAAGAMLIGVGASREGRAELREEPGCLGVTASAHDGAWWGIAYHLPFSFLEDLMQRPVAPHGSMRANFYKCEERAHPHFGCWSRIEAPRPDFHRPGSFGELNY